MERQMETDGEMERWREMEMERWTCQIDLTCQMYLKGICINQVPLYQSIKRISGQNMEFEKAGEKTSVDVEIPPWNL